MANQGIARNLRMAGIFSVLFLGLIFPYGAVASPIVGQQIYYEGGNVTVTVLPYSAAYTSNLYLFSAPSPVFIANSSNVGHVVALGNLETLYGIRPGDELIFGIRVLNTGNTFLMGPGGRNADGLAHASVDYAEGTTSDFATLGFEDLLGGGDLDFNDAFFQLEGGIGNVGRVPEPASLILLALGLAVAALVSRSLFGVACREHAGRSLT